MLGFELDFWDYVTFATAAAAGASVLLIYIWIAGLPGRIALARNHPEAEAVKLLGWAGLLPTIYPWAQALIWAYKPTDVVDIRRFPREEARAEAEDLARLKDEARVRGKHSKPTDPETSARDTSAPPWSSDEGSKTRPGLTHASGVRPVVRLRVHRVARLFQVQMAQVHHRMGFLLRVLRGASDDHHPDRLALRRTARNRGEDHPAHDPAHSSPP